MSNETQGKVCTKCGEWKLLEEFGPSKLGLFGRDSRCRACRRALKAERRKDPAVRERECLKTQEWRRKNPERAEAYRKQYRTENADYFREHAKRWNREHPERTKENYQAWRQRNPERLKELKRKHNSKAYAANPAKFLEQKRRWRTANIEKARQVVATSGHKRNAFKQGLTKHHTNTEWQALCDWFGNVCLCCGAAGPLTRDHVIPLNPGGNGIDNIQPLCQSCNSRKHRQHDDYRDPATLAAFLAMLDELYQE